MKIGRNSLCWCGSGKKYKKCHLYRSEQSPLSRQELEQSRKKLKSRKICFVPSSLKKECTKKIIKAHTISKSAGLKVISEQGHVMGIKPSLSSLIRTSGLVEIEKIGINEASTITGFCSKHDKELFSPIENDEFIATKKQLFLLAYRPVIRELYAKEATKNSLGNIIREADRGQDLDEQVIAQYIANEVNSGIDIGSEDIRYIKKHLDEILLNKTYEKLEHYIFELKEPPKIMASASIALEIDFNGKHIQSLDSTNKKVSSIIFNLVSFNKKGFFIISWINEHSKLANDFISSLTSYNDDRIGDLIVGFIYTFCENVYASPSWWDSLNEGCKEDIIKRLHHGLPSPSFPPREDNCLEDKGLEFKAINIGKHYPSK